MQRLILAAFAATLGLAAPLQASTRRSGRRPPAAVINGHSTAALGTSSATRRATSTTSTGRAPGRGRLHGDAPLAGRRGRASPSRRWTRCSALDGDFGLSRPGGGAPARLPDRRAEACPYVGAWVGRPAGALPPPTTSSPAKARTSPCPGSSVRASGGVQMFLSPKLALDGGLSLGFGKFGNIKANGEKQDSGTPDNTTTHPAPLRRELVSLTRTISSHHLSLHLRRVILHRSSGVSPAASISRRPASENRHRACAYPIVEDSPRRSRRPTTEEQNAVD